MPGDPAGSPALRADSPIPVPDATAPRSAPPGQPARQPPAAAPEPPHRPEPAAASPASSGTGRPDAIRRYAASLFTADASRRADLEPLLALARTPATAPQVVAVVSSRDGSGASATAAGLARTLASVRDDYTALLRVPVDPVDIGTLREVGREHAFTVVDLGAHAGAETPQVLAASSQLVVVTGADRRAAEATRLTLARVHEVHPGLAGAGVIAVVCRTAKQYRRVLRELREDRSPQAAQIVPVPPDPALATTADPDLPRLRTATREAYLRLAASLTSARALRAPDPAGDGPPTGQLPTYTTNLHP